ncbi:hypothetical protein B0H34DRAFT_661502 [Crassisporium funariophilum]|nr:hypothetical protein B0H34DRAFT_661502 [Crassisporium funariophilum]
MKAGFESYSTGLLVDHEFRRSQPGGSRSPCPALNALANHGYISREGTGIKFWELTKVMVDVYNITYPLAILLSLAGFITCGKVSSPPIEPMKSRSASNSRNSWKEKLVKPIQRLLKPLTSLLRVSWTLDLGWLTQRGASKIAHDASLVHPSGVTSTAPDAKLLEDVLSYASTVRGPDGALKNGLDLRDIAHLHAGRVQSALTPLSNLHRQIAFGECGLIWEMLKGRDSVVPTARLQQWLGEERLPDGWWDKDGVRPKIPVGLFRARKTADMVGAMAEIPL